MKRVCALALAVALLLCGCGKSNDNTDKDGNNATVKLGEVTVTVGDTLTDGMKDALGEPTSVEEAPSCHYEGMDTIYRYDGFSIQTYRKDDTDRIAIVTIETADHTTDKGVKVGDSIEAVKGAYGAAVEETPHYVVYTVTDEVSLTFELDGDKVAVILYEEKA